MSVLFIEKAWNFKKRFSNKGRTLLVKCIKTPLDVTIKAWNEAIVVTLLLTVKTFLHLCETQNTLQLAVFFFFFTFFCKPYPELWDFKSVFLILKVSQYGGLRLWVRNPCKNWYENCYIHFYKTYNQQTWEARTSRRFDSTSRCWWHH